MAIILTQRRQVKNTEANKKNIERAERKAARKMRMKTHPKLRAQLKEIAESIEKAKKPEKVVKVKSLRNVPRSAFDNTKAFLKSEPKNRNPETGRQRAWTYQKYPAILPPQQFIRKVARAPKPTLVGRMAEKTAVRD